jgi:hypothetical protein
MQRTIAILAVFLGAAAGCRGGATQSHAAPALGARAPRAETIASEPEAPWAIALLSDATEAPRRRSGKVVVVDVTDDQVAAISREVDLRVAVKPEPSDDKPAGEKPEAPKSCSGVVNRRS